MLHMLRGWVHSGFNVYRSRRVLPDEREDLGPFPVDDRHGWWPES